MAHGDEGVRREPVFRAECEENLAKIVIRDAVRGVQEDQVVRLARRRCLDDLFGFAGAQFGAGQTEALDVLPDGAGGSGVGLDEQGVARAAGKGFEADRS